MSSHLTSIAACLVPTVEEGPQALSWARQGWKLWVIWLFEKSSLLLMVSEALEIAMVWTLLLFVLTWLWRVWSVVLMVTECL